ncbi:MAG: DUF502 domain-containing protein [Thermoguttaceae bacterium]
MENPSSEISQTVRETLASSQTSTPVPVPFAKLHPFVSAIVRGLALVLPPLLTVVIFIWLGASVKNYVVAPIYYGARTCLVTVAADIVREKQLPTNEQRRAEVEYRGKKYKRLADATYVPKDVYVAVQETVQPAPMPSTAAQVYEVYFQERYLEPQFFFPLVSLIFVLLLYIVGKLVSVRVGRFLWRRAESGLDRVPLVRNVYGAVKQVVDFIFAERSVSFSRVVAVEWPRRGIWSLALVTSEGIDAIRDAAGEPVYSVLIPTSPMPMTGFTLHIKQSDVVELDLTIDQAIQFIVSCGVVVPGTHVNDET